MRHHPEAKRSKFGLGCKSGFNFSRDIKGRQYELHWVRTLTLSFLGSQMSNIRDITKGVKESAKFYTELSKLGVNIKYFDVGGGIRS